MCWQCLKRQKFSSPVNKSNPKNKVSSGCPAESVRGEHSEDEELTAGRGLLSAVGTDWSVRTAKEGVRLLRVPSPAEPRDE